MGGALGTAQPNPVFSIKYAQIPSICELMLKVGSKSLILKRGMGGLNTHLKARAKQLALNSIECQY